MTHAGFLTMAPNGGRSTLVIRAALVTERLLHDEPLPPQPNAPELGFASTQPRTNRKLVEPHQQQAVCASCHKQMDVLGLGLENFDTTGGWRDTGEVGGRQVPIQPSGTSPDGSAFRSVQQPRAALLVHRNRLAEELVESVMPYALGRTIDFPDADGVAEIVARPRNDQFHVRSLVSEIALSPLFRSRRSDSCEVDGSTRQSVRRPFTAMPSRRIFWFSVDSGTCRPLAVSVWLYPCFSSSSSRRRRSKPSTISDKLAPDRR